MGSRKPASHTTRGTGRDEVSPDFLLTAVTRSEIRVKCTGEKYLIGIYISLTLPLSKLTMTYIDIPLIIPVLATGYLLMVYLLLILAQRSAKGGRQEPRNVRLSD